MCSLSIFGVAELFLVDFGVEPKKLLCGGYRAHHHTNETSAHTSVNTQTHIYAHKFTKQVKESIYQAHSTHFHPHK